MTQKEIDAEGFTQRQLNDTKYAARYMLQYLRSIFTPDEWKAERRILTVKGGQTSDLRHYWGLNEILHNSDFLPEDLEPGEKNRSDHRHHALDALVIALTDTMQLKRLATYKYRSPSQRQGGGFPRPWLTFRDDAEASLNAIVVSHRPKGRVRGGLHEDTFYGPVKDKRGEEKKGEYVRRKEIQLLSAKEIMFIRDDRIRQMVLDRFQDKFRMKPNANGKLKCSKSQLKEVLATPFRMIPKSPHADIDESEYPPINKVRLVLPQDASLPLRKDRKVFVRPGGTHHICIFEWIENGRLVRDVTFTTRLNANQRIRKQERLLRNAKKDLTAQGITGDRLKQQLRVLRSRIVKENPVVCRNLPEDHLQANNPTVKFLMSLKPRESLEILTEYDIDNIVDDPPKTQLVIYMTSGSTSKQLFFKENLSAFKKPQKSKSDDAETEDEDNLDQEDEVTVTEKKKIVGRERFSVSLKRIYRKVSIDRLGNVNLAND